MKKLDDKRYGPFKVIKKIGLAVYKLKLPSRWKRVHSVFNEVLLLPYLKPQFPSQVRPLPPSPTITGSADDEYEVECILDSRIHRGKLQYLVHWRDYPPSERTWEPADHLSNARKLVQAFYNLNPGAPQPLSHTRMMELVGMMSKFVLTAEEPHWATNQEEQPRMVVLEGGVMS